MAALPRAPLWIVCGLALLTTGLVAANPTPQILPVWPGDAPGSAGKPREENVRLSPGGDHVVSGIHQPSLTVYLPTPERATGAAVVICPGGGHRELWVDHEGHNVAAWLAGRGVAAMVLKYRLAREAGSSYSIEGDALADAQRAIRLVRHHATDWRLDPARVGIMGFSAGGEVAALAANREAPGDAAAADAINRENGQPAFQALIYPGNSKSITPLPTSPPAFLACGYDDRPDISEGITRVYLAFKQASVPAELHIYTGTGHGFGFRAATTLPSSAWLERFHEWLGERHFLQRP